MATILGTSNADTLTGSPNDDTVEGGAGADQLLGEGGNDQLVGGDGNDTLMGGAGDDVIEGGAGDDRAVFSADVSAYTFVFRSNVGQFVVTDKTAGRDGVDVVSGIELYSFGGVSKTSLDVQSLVQMIVVVPTAGNDYLNGTFFDDTLDGLAGNDTLVGGKGNDSLLGGLGADDLAGGEDNDTLVGGAGDDSLAGGIGIDTALFASQRSAYQIQGGPDGFFVTGEGVDSIYSTERLRFSDGGLAIDLALGQSSANAVLVVGALLGPGALASVPLMTNAIAFFDTKSTLLQGCETLVSAGVVASLAGSNSNRALVSLLFQNLTGSQPAALIDAITASVGSGSGQQSQAQLLAAAASLDLTQSLVNLAGLAQTGIAFG